MLFRFVQRWTLIDSMHTLLLLHTSILACQELRTPTESRRRCSLAPLSPIPPYEFGDPEIMKWHCNSDCFQCNQLHRPMYEEIRQFYHCFYTLLRKIQFRYYMLFSVLLL